jgi:hypothetical protein
MIIVFVFDSKKWFVNGLLFGINVYHESDTILYYDEKSILIDIYGIEEILDSIWEYYERNNDNDMHYNYSVGCESLLKFM